jgi:hypothetical protein
VLVSGGEHNVDVVGHQAIGPHFRLRAIGGAGEQIEIERIVSLLEECRLPPVAALGNVVGNAGNDDAGQTGHGFKAGTLLRVPQQHCAPMPRSEAQTGDTVFRVPEQRCGQAVTRQEGEAAV